MRTNDKIDVYILKDTSAKLSQTFNLFFLFNSL